MRKKLVSNSPYLQESKKKKREILKKKLLISSIIFLLIFFSLALLSRSSRLTIKNIEVSGNTVIDSTAIQDLVQKEISGNYLWFFPKANFLIYPKGLILQELGAEFKILKDVKVNLKGVNTLEISFSEREGKYTWCGTDLPMSAVTPEQCYFMDSDGYIFGPAPYFSGDVYLKFYGQVADTADAPQGDTFAPSLFAKLLSFYQSVKNMGIKASSFLVKPDGNIELYLSSSVPFPDKPKIILKADADMDKTAENLQTALSTDPLQTDFKNKFSSLVYIDLRYGNKVYYKFK